MTHSIHSAIAARGATGPQHRPARNVWRELQHREPRLALLALVMLLAAVPTVIALGIDERQLRGVSVWAKPLKFMLSVALFSATTAWFVGLLPQVRRRTPVVLGLAWTLVVAASAEVAYIAWQAGLGAASHYNASDTLHTVLYQLMGVGALMMMLTQPVLAWQIARHGRDDLHPVWRWSVVLGLCMTFVLGVGAAAPLASAQPPSGPGLPLLGWHLAGGDLRPAHFIGSHAQQLVPLMGLLLLRAWPRRASWALAAFALAYTGLWLVALLRGLQGAVWQIPA